MMRLINPFIGYRATQSARWVSGAGSSAVNGKYVPTGLLNDVGFEYLELEAGGYYMARVVDGFGVHWMLHTSFNSADQATALYRGNNERLGTPDLGSWGEVDGDVGAALVSDSEEAPYGPGPWFEVTGTIPEFLGTYKPTGLYNSDGIQYWRNSNNTHFLYNLGSQWRIGTDVNDAYYGMGYYSNIYPSIAPVPNATYYYYVSGYGPTNATVTAL